MTLAIISRVSAPSSPRKEDSSTMARKPSTRRRVSWFVSGVRRIRRMGWRSQVSSAIAQLNGRSVIASAGRPCARSAWARDWASARGSEWVNRCSARPPMAAVTSTLSSRPRRARSWTRAKSPAAAAARRTKAARLALAARRSAFSRSSPRWRRSSEVVSGSCCASSKTDGSVLARLAERLAYSVARSTAPATPRHGPRRPAPSAASSRPSTAGAAAGAPTEVVSIGVGTVPGGPARAGGGSASSTGGEPDRAGS